MSFIIYNTFIIKKFISIFLTGIVIKLMDDYMDSEFDDLIKNINLAKFLGKGVVPYTLFVFSLASMLNYSAAITLFFASYITGMTTNFDEKMPSGLFGYQEMIIIFLFGCIVFGTAEMFSSLFLIIAIQLWDDYVDYHSDKYSIKNLAFVLGRNESLLLGIIFLISSMYIDCLKTLSGIASMLIIVYIINLRSIKYFKFENPER
ncbi:MAG: hypothetical protein NUV45_06300 [Tepidanaerobacteraceae bacterium]|nr:hypothetical protein [Tepidanaerobacteraceae bacterium]